ncbi:class I SAM-dependent methyltransferase [Thermogemmatispora carboxidivorans]|uniref:class I SAM-dependent methyltransferase n=1 Tax=Thermogemmatispora carboxidivorans TaxID=1382306 RepID=UPI00069ABEF5|nr:class I SAM-dependent methyltransferase [Thermogemmatispora carboxidivorans]
MSVRERLRQVLFETLYRNRYLYRFASTVPFAGQWRVWQRLVLPRVVGHDVLELGCGLGDLLADLCEQGYRCMAVERSPEMVAAARATLQRRRVGQPGQVLLGEAQHLPFADASFDTVVSTFPSDYIFDPDTIAEVARVLRPGGRLVVVEGANLLPVGLLQPVLLLVHLLVYGFYPRSSSLEERHRVVRVERDEATGLTTEELPATPFGRRIPLERYGLRRRAERVRSRRWEVYLTIGEKPSA